MDKKTEQEIAGERDTIVITILIALVVFGFILSSDMFGVGFKLGVLASFSFSFLVARYGKERKIGYLRAFLLSFFLSPVIGLLITLSSPRLEDEEYKEKMLRATENNSAIVNSSIADELFKLNELRKEGILTNEEFEMQKERLLNP